VRLSRGYLPGMKERRWGRIIFIFQARVPFRFPPEMIHYGMTKTAQVCDRARAWLKTCSGTDVTINCVPGGAPPHPKA